MVLGVALRYSGLGVLAGAGVSAHYLWHKWTAYEAELTQRLNALSGYREAHVAEARARLAALDAPR